MDEKLYVGDPHRDRRAYIYEENGARFVCKPRSSSTERAWAAFLSALADMGMQSLPAAILPMSEDENGSVFPFVERREDCDAGQSCRKFGTLCAICDLFGSTDLHDENVLFGKDGPVLCDLETLLPTRDKISEPLPMGGSCLSTGLVADFRALRNGGGEIISDVSALSSAPFDVCIYKEEILSAMRDALRFLYLHKADILPLAGLFAGCEARYLLRPTDIYYRICAAAKKRDDPARFIADSLARAYKSLPDSLVTVLEYETASLQSANIPLFYCEADGLDLCADGRIIAANFFAAAPIDILKSRISTLSEAFLRDEEIILRSALNIGESFVCFGHDEIKRTIEENTLSDGCTLKVYSDNKVKTLIKSGMGIYSGVAGRIVYFSALAICQGDNDAKARIYPLCEALRANVNDVGLGFADGLGGMIFALHCAFDALGEPTPMKIAAELFMRTRMASEERDFYSGAAGSLAVLPLLKGYADDAVLIGAAKKLAVFLREYKPEQTGLAHGMAGISAALASAAALAGDNFDSEVAALIEAENAYYDEALYNWRDARGVFVNGICSGAPGIYFARQIVLKQTKNQKIRSLCEADLHRVLAFIDSYIIRRGDYDENVGSLCCGKPASDLCAVLCGVSLEINNHFAAESLGLFDGIAGQALASGLRGYEGYGGTRLF